MYCIHGRCDIICRYLRATKWESPQKAIKRLEETLQWRRDFGLYDERFTTEHVEPEVRVRIVFVLSVVLNVS